MAFFSWTSCRSSHATCWKPGYPGNPKAIGEHLKKRRLDLELSQKELARHLGTNEWSVINWETGEHQPAVRYYPLIIRFLGYNPFPKPGESFPERLKAARKTRGLSWKRLAKELGVWETTVRDRENGTNKPTKLLYARLCRFLELWFSRVVPPANRVRGGLQRSLTLVILGRIFTDREEVKHGQEDNPEAVPQLRNRRVHYAGEGEEEAPRVGARNDKESAFKEEKEVTVSRTERVERPTRQIGSTFLADAQRALSVPPHETR